jgi:hypothetical protein
MGRIKAYVLSTDADIPDFGFGKFDKTTEAGIKRHEILVMENATRVCSAYSKAGRKFVTEMLTNAGVDHVDIAKTLDKIEDQVYAGMHEDDIILASLGDFEALLEKSFFHT